MKTALYCLVCTSMILAACSSRVTSREDTVVVNQTASAKKYVRKRKDPPVRFDLSQAQAQLNDYRRRHRLGSLSHHPQLQKAADRHAAELARYSRVSHSGRNGSNPAQRLTKAGYRWSAVGENVSAGRNSISEVIKAWHNSPLHRKNLKLRQAVHFGLAVKHNPDSVLSNYWVLIVGAPERGSRGKMKIGFGGRDN